MPPVPNREVPHHGSDASLDFLEAFHWAEDAQQANIRLLKTCVILKFVEPSSTAHPFITLPEAEFFALANSNEILESTVKRGPKVIALPDNQYLKVLRVKRKWLTTWKFVNPAKRFIDNALKLQRLGIPTLTVEQIYRVPHIECWAVRYRGLEGTSIRKLLEQEALTDQILHKLVSFIKKLHDQGIYFRGLHPGNILLTPSGEIGLIDILDCHFFPYLFDFQRRNNFSHFFRYPETKLIEAKFISSYNALQ